MGNRDKQFQIFHLSFLFPAEFIWNIWVIYLTGIMHWKNISRIYLTFLIVRLSVMGKRIVENRALFLSALHQNVQKAWQCWYKSPDFFYKKESFFKSSWIGWKAFGTKLQFVKLIIKSMIFFKTLEFWIQRLSRKI